jgi:hypothetical protein
MRAPAAVITAVCLLTLPQVSEAKEKDKHKSNGSSHNRGHDSSHHDDHDRQSYLSRPRSTFVLSLGTGYAGRGYYYGPPNCPYPRMVGLHPI